MKLYGLVVNDIERASLLDAADHWLMQLADQTDDHTAAAKFQILKQATARLRYAKQLMEAPENEEP